MQSATEEGRLNLTGTHEVEEVIFLSQPCTLIECEHAKVGTKGVSGRQKNVKTS